jgi:hypothetical protein
VIEGAEEHQEEQCCLPGQRKNNDDLWTD